MLPLLFETDLIQSISFTGIFCRNKLSHESSAYIQRFSWKCLYHTYNFHSPKIQLSTIKVPFHSSLHWHVPSAQSFCFPCARDLCVILQITFYLCYKGFPFQCPLTSPFLLPMMLLLLHSIFLPTCILRVATQPPGVRCLHFTVRRAAFPPVTQTLVH